MNTQLSPLEYVAELRQTAEDLRHSSVHGLVILTCCGRYLRADGTWTTSRNQACAMTPARAAVERILQATAGMVCREIVL